MAPMGHGSHGLTFSPSVRRPTHARSRCAAPMSFAPGYLFMNSQNEAALHWGVHLTGHQFDLEDWEEALRSPFDPWVERMEAMYILRSLSFDGLQIPEVRGRAEALIERLNGAMAAAKGSRPVCGQDVVQFTLDGVRHHHVLLAESLDLRVRVGTARMAIGSDGAVVPEAGLQPSEVQRWTAIADTDDRLADALVYLSRAEWFDLYKAIECVEDRAGGEAALDKLGWIEPGELKRIKRTANAFRHRRGGRHSPPPQPATHEEAFRAVTLIVGSAFKDADAAAGGRHDVE
jgi:hypothetical protein